MKKIFTILAAAMMAVTVMAEGDNGKAKFTYEAGAEVVSSYIWRGLYNGGMSFQPAASVGFVSNSDKVKFQVGVWGNIGASDWKFRKGFDLLEDGRDPNTYFVPEFDMSAELQIYGVVLGATHYYYFGGTQFFSSRNEEGGSQTEVMFGLRFGDFSKASGLYFNWYTMVAGNDQYDKYKVRRNNQIDTVSHRAWSSYIELGYEAEFEHDITLNICVGFTPWRSLYTDYRGTFAVNNISLRFGKTWNVADIVDIELFALGSMNTYGINKKNCFQWKAGEEKVGSYQRLNGSIGLGFWF